MVCVIMKESLANSAKEIRTNVEYNEEQYLDFAIVPPEIVDGIVATNGYCDLELSKDGKTVVSFTAREIPAVNAPTTEEILNALLGVNE